FPMIQPPFSLYAASNSCSRATDFHMPAFSSQTVAPPLDPADPASATVCCCCAGNRRVPSRPSWFLSSRPRPLPHLSKVTPAGLGKGRTRRLAHRRPIFCRGRRIELRRQPSLIHTFLTSHQPPPHPRQEKQSFPPAANSYACAGDALPAALDIALAVRQFVS